MPKKNFTKVNNQGFSLIELMVSISIVVLVVSIILANHNTYNNAVLLRSQAYDIALKIREVQLLAVSAVGQGGGETSSFRNEIGLYFNSDSNKSGYYQIYLDSSNEKQQNSAYDPGEEIGLQGNIDPRFFIANIRRVNAAGFVEINNVSIVFERPNFDARFFEGKDELEGVAAIEIDLGFKNNQSDSSNNVRTIEVTKTGQIIVQPRPRPSKPGEFVIDKLPKDGGSGEADDASSVGEVSDVPIEFERREKF